MLLWDTFSFAVRNHYCFTSCSSFSHFCFFSSMLSYFTTSCTWRKSILETVMFPPGEGGGNIVCSLVLKRRETNFLLLICSVHFHIFIFVTTIRTCFDGITFSSVFLINHSRDHIQQAIYIPYVTIDFIRMSLYFFGLPIYFTKN